jgi:hypothetical protein
VVEDLDRDGLADVAVVLDTGCCTNEVAEVAVMYSVGGVLSAPVRYELVPPIQAHALAAGELSGGGRRDLVALDAYGHGLALLASLPAGGLAPATRFALPLPGQVVVLADLDGDLRDEIVVGSPWGLAVHRTACGP